MKFVVVDVAAEHGGALTVLKAFHEAVAEKPEHEWIFVVSTVELPDAARVRVMRFRWIKRSWIHRIWFDLVVAPRVIRKSRPDAVLSLQNLAVPFIGKPQVVYLHQSLPFAKFRYRLKDQPLMWFYQNLMGKLIRRSIKTAQIVVVQTKWMEKAVREATEGSAVDVRVVPVDRPQVANSARFQWNTVTRRRFFYPAGPQVYKNHRVLIRAAEMLELREVGEFEVIVTVEPGDLARMGFSRIPRSVRPIGRIPHPNVLEEYQRSILVFPSELESSPLPPAEARAVGCPILASDTEFCHEVLGAYRNAHFFPSKSAEALADLMQQVITKSIPYSQDFDSVKLDLKEVSGWISLIRLLEEVKVSD